MLNKFLKTTVVIFTLVLITLIAISAANADSCRTDADVLVSEKVKDINTDVPKHLAGATIIIRKKDGKEEVLRAEDYKVVKRKQQFIVTETSTKETVTCTQKDKNLLMIGGRRDHKDLDVRVLGKTATVESEKGLVLDIGYMRQNILDSNLGVGAGIDSNGTLRGTLGIEF